MSLSERHTRAAHMHTVCPECTQPRAGAVIYAGHRPPSPSFLRRCAMRLLPRPAILSHLPAT